MTTESQESPEPVHATLELASGDARIVVGLGEAREIGRVAMAGLGVAQDPLMSARHFAIRCERDHCRLRDLGSTNGTFVNDSNITEATLHDGDRIVAGQSTFVVRLYREPTPVGSVLPPASIATASPAPERPIQGLPLFQIANNSPFAVTTLRWHDADDRPRLSIVVKATFTLGSEVRLTPKQLPIFDADIVSDGDPRSVRFESDRVPFKPCTDVVLVGRAHAPDRKPVTELIAGLRVGQLRYGVVVVGDRKWEAQLLQAPEISQPQPFLSMDLTYERAFGGFDKRAGMYCKENHVGTGFIGKRPGAGIEGIRLPNLEDPRNRIHAWNSHPRPVGFGFFGRGWAPRLSYAGTYDDQHMKQRHPRLPIDFSYRFFNGAHPDLQVGGYLRGDEEVDLLNVCPDAPRMHFQLPGFVPKITVSRWTVAPEQWALEQAGLDGSTPTKVPLADEPLKVVLDTLVFVPEQDVFYEVFRAVCGLSSLESLEVARITISP